MNEEQEHHGKTAFLSTSTASFPRWLKMRLKEGPYPQVEQKQVESIKKQTDVALIHSTSESPRATWIGHATMLVQYRGINYLTDPHLTDYPSPMNFGVPGRYLPPALAFSDMPKIDFVLISHNHYDHLDHRTVDLFGSSVVWYVPLGLGAWFRKRGIRSEKIVELDWWQSHQFHNEAEITFTPAIHWSKRAPWDTNRSLWGSWSVSIDGFRAWFGGDTAYNETQFKEIGHRTGPYHLAMIPIGAYAPRYFMSPQHVNPTEAVMIHKDIRSALSIPIHWGTFQLTHEPFLEPIQLLAEATKAKGLPEGQFKHIKIGETKILKELIFAT